MSDNFLLIVFGNISTIALGLGILGVYFAMQTAKKNESEIKMAFWSVIALAGFTVAGMSWAYF
ncbi:MAG: hypothetical protein L0Y80_12960 [Ignavibacteriae bacterium]|nr:hypothetical protein [Ignavibacteriota bacterium]